MRNILHIRACSINTCLKYRSTTNPKRRFPKQRFRNANTVYFIDTTKRYDKILIILLKVFTLFVHFLAIPHLSDSEFLDSKAEQPAVPCKLHMKLCFTTHSVKIFTLHSSFFTKNVYLCPIFMPNALPSGREQGGENILKRAFT